MVDYKAELKQTQDDSRQAQVLAALQETHLLPEGSIVTQIGTPLAHAFAERKTRHDAVIDAALTIAKARGEHLDFGWRAYKEEHVPIAVEYLEGVLAEHKARGQDRSHFRDMVRPSRDGQIER